MRLCRSSCYTGDRPNVRISATSIALLLLLVGATGCTQRFVAAPFIEPNHMVLVDFENAPDRFTGRTYLDDDRSVPASAVPSAITSVDVGP